MEEDSFIYTDMEKRYIGGSSEKPCVCVMVRNILARVESGPRIAVSDFPRGILTLSEDGSTLTMDDRVEYTAARHIPNLGAKKLIVSRNMDTLRSFGSIEDFEEIVFQRPEVFAREKVPFHPKKSVIIRFKFNLSSYEKPIDSAVLLYLPSVADNSPQAERLYALYDRCLGKEFNFARYDSEILGLVSSYHARFTIAYLRLKGGYKLSSGARERYENFLLAHRRKAESFAIQHGDTDLLSLLEKIPAQKGDLHNTAPQSSPRPVSVNAVRPVPAKPDMDVPDNFTPYEGADMTCAEADAAGFEFVGADRYHGVDFWLRSKPHKNRNIIEEVTYVGRG
ncbi:MAG: hypothetical protein K2N72_04325, partial [Oscillospiraceae bacterium]|nr:hypothetical protein [Oscillospiraceae bacterium]